MASPVELPRRVRFGPFEVIPQSVELLKHGIRVRLPGQPFAILLLLLKYPGEVVTREQLREQIWGEGTFVDFEHSLNAAMNKLRRALGDSADNPRYIETVPGRGYRFIGSLESGDSQPAPMGLPETEPEQSRPKRRSLAPMERISWAIAALACLFIGLRVHRGTAEPPVWKLTRITADPGLSGSPVLSPDGRLVAYSSDRGRDGERDLYLRQVTGGKPIRLTSDGSGNAFPDFSPDASTIVFRSNRNGGGVFRMPALGGDARLLAPEGRSPKFSPDGASVAYWIGTESVAASVPGSGTVWVIPSSGGAPRQIHSKLTAARYPIWTPDGKHLLVIGYMSSKAFDSSGIDWWLLPLDGGDPVKTGFQQLLDRTGLSNLLSNSTPVPGVPRPGCWQGNNRVLFSVANGGTQNLWRVPLSPDSGKVSGPLERVTIGSGNEVDPSCAANGTIAFTKVDVRQNIWLLPFNMTLGSREGALERVSDSPAVERNPSLSPNGRHMAFQSDRTGRGKVWVRELATGTELIVADSSFVQGFPVSSASGMRTAFSVYENEKRVLYVASPGGTPERLCEGCLRATDWSRDEQNLLVFGGDPYQISVLNVASRQQAPLLRHLAHSLLYGRYSPDNRWVSFTIRLGGNRGRIAVAPIGGPKPVPESAWIPIADVAADDYALWAPDGNRLYFTSRRDGHNCIWGQRIDQASRRPIGDVFPVQHLHGRLSFAHGGWSAVDGRIALSLVEASGNIWMMSGGDTK